MQGSTGHYENIMFNLEQIFYPIIPKLSNRFFASKYVFISKQRVYDDYQFNFTLSLTHTHILHIARRVENN